MANLNSRGAYGGPLIALAPIAGDSGGALSASRRTSIGAAGDTVVVFADNSFHLVAGDSTVVATTANAGPFPAGVYAFVLPDACTHVAMIQATGATSNGGAYKG